MKKILALICLACICACSNDDDPKQSKKKYLTEMILTNEGVSTTYHFEYDASKNISAIRNNEDEDDNLYYTYNGTSVSTIRVGQDLEPAVTLIYTADKLTGYTNSFDDYTPINYNQQTKNYLFGDEDYQYEVILKNRDVAKINIINSGEYFYMNFDQNRKGPLYNVATNNIFLMNLFSTLSPFLFVNAPTDFMYSQELFTCENTYDKDNYLTKMILTSNEGSNLTVNYTYEEM